MKVTMPLARAFAAKLADEKGVQDFKASNSWISGFMKRYKLSLRRITNLSTLSDEKLIERSVSYMQFLRRTHSWIELY